MLTKNRRRRAWLRVVSALSCVVVFCTVYALILPAITLEKKPLCGNTDHTHSEACYTQATAGIPVCTPESLVHRHTDECLDENGAARCGYADFVVHTHNDSCYDENGTLWCPLPEILAHTHGDACYAMEQPAETEQPAHVHTDACYAWSRGALSCGLEENHTHGEGCYALEQSLTCTLEEGAEHTHTDACYQQEPVLKCATPENHSHTDACYEQVRGELTCGLTETAETTSPTQEDPQRVLIHEEAEIVIHTHTADCFEKDENGEPIGFPICGQLEVLEHVHNDACFRSVEPMTAAAPASARLDGTFVYTGDSRFTLTLEVHGTVPVAGEAPAEVLQAQSQDDSEPDGESQPEQNAAAAQEQTDVQAQSDVQEQTGTQEQTDTQTQADPQGQVNARETAALNPETLHLSVEVLGEEDPDHAAAVAKLPENSMIPLALRFSLRDEREQIVDLTNCEVLDTLNLTQGYYDQILADAAGQLTGGDGTKTLTLSLCQLTDTALQSLASVPLKAEEGHTVLGAEGVKSGVLALMAKSAEDPTFTVQYYGNLKKLVTSMHLKREGYSDENYQAPDISTEGAIELNILNTGNPGKSEDGQYLGLGLDQYGRYRDVNGAGGSLPTNSATSPTFKVYLQEENGVYRAIRNLQLMNIYKDRSYTYSESHTLDSIDILQEDGHYNVKEVWVLKPGEGVDPYNLDKTKWDSYPANGIQFTNDPTAADSQTVYIPDGAVIRLVYEETKFAGIKAPAKFYDYDITDGTGNTLQQGINSPENYPEGEGAKLAFGNSNTATSLGDQSWNGQHLNEFNDKGANQNESAPQSTFGITTGLDEYGRIRYADGILAPKLFDDDNGEPVTGKENYDNGEFRLVFDRIGSTYTLAQVVTKNGDEVTGNLRAFTHTSAGPYSNNFWPLDSAPGADGTTGGDGASGAPIVDNGTASYYGWPPSDDGVPHNNMFGMDFQVDFQLDGDYCGPLEYYFFGDDDLWVYLDGKLICDIGGVHMSNGEFVNLWDWIPHDDANKHTMKIYYTERGLSGSTCYMRFTIPGATIEAGGSEPLGTLEVAKVMRDPAETVTEPFDFTAAFAFPGNAPKNVSYRRLDAEGKQTERGTMPLSGGKVSFRLKAGETVRFLELPAGTAYTVQERTEFYEVTNTVNGTASQTGDTAEGTVTGGKMDEVLYTNQSLGSIDVTVRKVWKDKDGAAVTETSALPKIEIELYQIKTEKESGTETEKRRGTIQLPIEGSWDYTWHGLPTKDNKGNTYAYRVGEPLGPGFIAGTPRQTTDESGNTTWEIVNTVTPPDPMALSVYKYWKNADGTAMAPPEDQSVEVQLYQKTGTKQMDPFHTVTINFPRAETKTYQVKSGEPFSYQIVFFTHQAATEEILFKTRDTGGKYESSWYYPGISAPGGYMIWKYSKTIDKVEQDVTITFTEGDEFYIWGQYLKPLYQGPDYEPTITAEYTAPAVTINWAKPVEYRTAGDPNAGKAALSKENQWCASWKDLPADNDLFTYLYYVKESSGPEEFTVTYLVDGTEYTSDTVDTVPGVASGVIEITNTSSKVEEPGNEKTVEENSTHSYGNRNDASVGQTVNFKSAVTLPVGSKSIVFHDTMSTGLTPYKAEGEIKVYTDDALTGELDAAHYTVDSSPADGCAFEISFAQGYLDSLTEKTAVYVSYAAAVNGQARMADGNPNISFLSYSDGHSTHTTPPSTTRTYTWGIDVLKYTVGGTNPEMPLSGARFTLREENGTDPIRLVKIKDGSADRPKTADVYRVAMTGEEGDPVETNATGRFSIQGLDAGTYYLTETAAPVGYKMSAGSIKVVIRSAANADGETMRATVSYYTYTGNAADPYGEMASGTGEIKIKNDAGIKLPSTGGMGVTAIYIGGLLLMASAAILLTVRKRRA